MNKVDWLADHLATVHSTNASNRSERNLPDVDATPVARGYAWLLSFRANNCRDNDTCGRSIAPHPGQLHRIWQPRISNLNTTNCKLHPTCNLLQSLCFLLGVIIPLKAQPIWLKPRDERVEVVSDLCKFRLNSNPHPCNRNVGSSSAPLSCSVLASQFGISNVGARVATEVTIPRTKRRHRLLRLLMQQANLSTHRLLDLPTERVEETAAGRS